MIYTLTLNPSLDYVMSLWHFESGKINRSYSEELIPAGKGINVSVMLKRLGTQSVASGFTAGFTGLYLEQYLEKIGILTMFTHLENGTTRINPKLRYNGETDINAAGPAVTLRDMQSLKNSLMCLKNGDVAVLCGSAPKGAEKDVYAEIMSEHRSDGVKFVIDAEGKLLSETFIYRPFLIKPNLEELCGIAGRELCEMGEITQFCKELVQRKSAENVLCSLGEKGAVLASSDGNVYTSKAVLGEVKSTTGAGDSLLAGFLSKYGNADIKSALDFAVSCGSAAAFTVGLPEKSDVEKIVESQNKAGR